MAPEVNVLKHLTVVIYKMVKYGRVFVPGRPFQPSLMFAGKDRSLKAAPLVLGTNGPAYFGE